MLELRYIEHHQADLVSRIIREAYAEQTRILKMNPAAFPNFVGFESTEGVYRRMEQGDQVLLAVFGDEPIGTISYRVLPQDPAHGHVKRFAILPRFRGHDYGKSMMDFAEAGLRLGGVTTAEISLVAAFTRLRDYYIRLGYAVKESKTFATVPFEVLFMEKSL